jgi:transcription-repair coupling factor (superfamily II helicase)
MMAEVLRTELDNSPLIRTLADKLRATRPGDVVLVTGVAGSLTALLVASLHAALERQLVLVMPEKDQALRAADDVALACGEGGVRLFLGREEHEAVLSGRSRESNDVQSLRLLTGGEVRILVTHAAGLAARLPLPAEVQRDALVLTRGNAAGFDATVRRLQQFRFDRADIVEQPGEYAIRGGIIDVFPFIGENPIRIEFFGDTVDSLREFDVTSQRSIRPLDAATVVPDLLSAEPGEQGMSRGDTTLVEYLSDIAVIVFVEPQECAEVWHGLVTAGRPDVVHPERLEEVLALFPRLHVASLPVRTPDVDVGARHQPAFNGSVQMLVRDLAERQAGGYRTLVTCETGPERDRIQELIGTAIAALDDTERPDPARVEYLLEPLHEGFLLPSLRLALYAEHQIFGRVKRHRHRRKSRFKGITESEMQQLRKGDYVVHEDFGIGRFAGLKTIQVRDVHVEVASVVYEDDDVLYVNISYLNKLQKYSSKDGHIPKVHRLGSGEWEKLKARTKKRVKDIARDLIRLYARRKHLEGFTFPTDTPWQKELEASFAYEDTFDQAKATVDVKRDMEAGAPMDRLICGDVGFGKTEVAVRAAFKAVMAGKQMAMLVPTTILALQHLNTFRDRMERYGTSIEVLSRFRSRKDQDSVLADLAEGKVDVLIGTHRILSKDVTFKDLGLLVIDEEHRFGVAAKEKLRHMRTQVDTLSLTATPIPRTLHFSLLGARDLSIIATPPRNRLPIITELIQWKDEAITDAVRREIRRGGQVYVVHDRVQTIADLTARLQQHLPDVRMRCAHGQMHAHELEEVMLAFLEKRVDLLVSTKIIESGLDIPNVNTIIINRADRFGMAELYQLRGRVGRSNVQAYAYLVIPPVSVMSRSTVQRLQALQEFNELGSGFNLAMRDLEIRGAGNMLGSEQSGFIEAMGFETYTRILDEAVREVKEEEFRDLFPEVADQVPARSVVVEADLEALIPESYVASERERLRIYRRLHGVSTPEQLEEVGQELSDRFGRLPEPVETLLGLMRIKLAAARLQLPKVHVGREMLRLSFPPESAAAFYDAPGFQQMMNVISGMRGAGVQLQQTADQLNALFPLGAKKPDEQIIARALEYLKAISSN